MNTYWNGLPIPAERGTAVVEDAPEFRHYWAKALVGRRIPVVRVALADGDMFLDNRGGDAWRKVTEGNGSPRWGHGTVRVSDFEPETP